MSNLSTLPKGDSAWLFRNAIERIMKQISDLETNIGSSTTGNSANTQIIFNDNGVLRGDPDLTFNTALNKLVATALESTTSLVVGTSATITGDLTVATSVLKVDTANTRVGINTTSINGGPFNVKISPAIDAKFVVQDGFTTGNVRLAAVDNAYSAYKIMDFSALSYAWYNSGSTAMTLNSTGLGVGVSPDFKFAVNGTQAVPDTTGSSTTNGSLRIGAPGTNLVIDTGVTAAGAVYGWIQARTRTDYSSNFNLVLQPNGGNVGIGVASPAYKLDVNGAANCNFLRVSNSSATALSLVNTTSGLTYSLYSANTASNGFDGFGIFNGTSYDLRIVSGNVGIGVTPSGTIYSVSETRLVVKGTSNNFAGTLAVQSKGTTNAVTGFLTASDNTNEVGVGSTTNSPLNFYTNNALKATIDASGNLGISSGNLVMSTSGKGVDFSAVTGGTGTPTANVLNDYEEGTFTPTIVGTTGAGTGTYTTQLGRYTKVGRIVTCDISLVWTAHTGTGNIDIGGLPFSVLNTTGYAASAVIGYIDNIALTAGNIPIAVLWWFNTTKIRLNQTPTGGGAAAGVLMDSAGQINLSITYIVA